MENIEIRTLSHEEEILLSLKAMLKFKILFILDGRGEECIPQLYCEKLQMSFCSCQNQFKEQMIINDVEIGCVDTDTLHGANKLNNALRNRVKELQRFGLIEPALDSFSFKATVNENHATLVGLNPYILNKEGLKTAIDLIEKENTYKRFEIQTNLSTEQQKLAKDQQKISQEQTGISSNQLKISTILKKNSTISTFVSCMALFVTILFLCNSLYLTSLTLKRLDNFDTSAKNSDERLSNIEAIMNENNILRTKIEQHESERALMLDRLHNLEKRITERAQIESD